ncbi:MAG: phage tail protein [Acetivibrionales bacterium]|jgi:phage tail-like protein
MVISNDPMSNFLFRVIIGPELRGNFARVSGLENEIEFEEYREGGVNDGVYYFPTNIRHSRLILERGVMNLNPMEAWYSAVLSGVMIRYSGMIMLINSFGIPMKIWAFKDAYPVKYVGPELNAQSSEVAVTRMEIIHGGLEVVPI